MPAADDHPIRLRRLRAGLTQVELARRAGVSRATIAQIEEGRTQRTNPAVISVLARHVPDVIGTITREVEEWKATPVDADTLSDRQKMALSLPPSYVAQYKSFWHWRRDVSNSTTAFASMLKIPRSTLVKYEQGRVSMPKVLYRNLHTQLGLSYEYIEELRKLDPEG